MSSLKYEVFSRYAFIYVDSCSGKSNSKRKNTIRIVVE